MNIIITQAIHVLAGLILSSNVFTRILAVVERWADKEISDLEKHDSVLNEIKIIGLNVAKWEANLGIELAVAYLKYK